MQQQDHPLWRLTIRLRQHVALSPDDAAALLALPHVVIERRQSAYLVRQADEVRHLAVLVSGCVVRHRTTRDGNRQLVSVSVPGDPLDLDHLYLPLADDEIQVARPAFASVTAAIALIPHEPLRALMAACPGVADALITAALVDMAAFREWVLNVGQRDARQRVAHLLCELCLRLELAELAAGAVVVPLNQIQIAEATGLTPVHVNRTLKALQAEGFVNRRDQLVEVPDWRRLTEVTDFDPHYLHARP